MTDQVWKSVPAVRTPEELRKLLMDTIHPGPTDETNQKIIDKAKETILSALTDPGMTAKDRADFAWLVYMNRTEFK